MQHHYFLNVRLLRVPQNNNYKHTSCACSGPARASRQSGSAAKFSDEEDGFGDMAGLKIARSLAMLTLRVKLMRVRKRCVYCQIKRVLSAAYSAQDCGCNFPANMLLCAALIARKPSTMTLRVLVMCGALARTPRSGKCLSTSCNETLCKWSPSLATPMETRSRAPPWSARLRAISAERPCDNNESMAGWSHSIEPNKC